MAENIFFIKVDKKSTSSEDEKFNIYLQCRWFESSIELLLCDTQTNKSYKVEIGQDEMFESALELEIPLDKFISECKYAFTDSNASASFEYEIEKEEPIFKLIKKTDFEIVYLMNYLTPIDSNFELLDNAIGFINSQRVKRESASSPVNKELQKSDEKLEEFDAKLQTLLEERSNEKVSLYKKFAIILNSKKAKIAELQEKLNKLQSNNVSGNQSINVDDDDISNNVYDVDTDPEAD
ncbi:DNA repair protein XRCC4 [Teleopsis dalmanni]|uniref:DNA repair protein XRCC4 n=1 Tax=Teleopsis dalmanni TaxID=139649 RepID=UPI0018CFEB81|nr:DNA repair protein XRCC4 [Teleopsis dalmanni]